MKHLLVALCVISISLKGYCQNGKDRNKTNWNTVQRLEHLKNIQDSTTWDMDKLNIDKQIIGLDMAGPFELAAFPVPRYELAGGSNNISNGNKSKDFKVNGRIVSMNAFYVDKNPINAEYLKDDRDEVFFHLLVLSDVVDADANSLAFSRNHPDYFGQGYIKTLTSNIEYAAFITAERDSFAIINTRLFNLNYGKTIIIAPQKDGTLRSIQIESPELTSELIYEYTESILQSSEVKSFLE